MPQPLHGVVLKSKTDKVSSYIKVLESEPMMTIKCGTSILILRVIPTQLVFSPFLGQVIVSSAECEIKQSVCFRGCVVQKHVFKH